MCLLAICVSSLEKTKKITRDKEGQYIMIKESIQEEDTTIVNIYSTNTGVPQYTRQTLTDIKGKINSNTIIVGDFNTPFTPMDREPKQKIHKETQALNDTLDQMNLTGISRTVHTNSESQHFLLKWTWNILQDHILNHKSSLGKLRKSKSYQAYFQMKTLWD